MKFLLLFLIVYAFCHEEPTYRYKISSENPILYSKLASLNLFDVDCSPDKEMEIFGVKSDEKILKELGFNIIEVEKSKPFSLQPPGYDNPESLFRKFKELETRYSSLAKIINLQQEYNISKTTDGNSIFSMKISKNVHIDEDESNLLIVSNHHCRELITPQIVLDTAERLLSQYSTNSTIKQLIDTNQIYLMWTMNPDGLDHVWKVNSMWRKNRNRNRDGSWGKDLNRNYGAGWSLSCAGSSVPRSETYRGESANSEIETQTMIAFQRDRNFAIVIDYHSYAREVRINYGSCVRAPTQIDTMFKSLADPIAAAQRYRRVNSCCTGGQISYAYAEEGSWANLIETGTAFQPPAAQMREELVRIWPGTLVGLTTKIPLSGHVVDESSGKGIRASINIKGLVWNLNEKRHSNEKRKGRYHLWLPKGTWDLTFSSNGYQNVEQRVTISGNGDKLDIKMKKN